MFLVHERVHFVGIGGAGMAPMAEIMLDMGYPITGSDREMGASTEYLESIGIRIQTGHHPQLILDADIVVHSSAVPFDNPELLFAKKSGKLIMKRAEMLGDLMRAKFCIGIAGTHGKTTTTSMIGKIMRDLGKDPTIVVGGHSKDLGSNALAGRGDVMVVEADEYDRSFLRMYPTAAVITNIEADHLDIYKDLDDIRNAFALFCERVPFYGRIIACIDDENVRALAKTVSRPVVTCGLAVDSDYCAVDPVFANSKTRFSVCCRGTVLGEVALPAAGIHNVKNAIAAIAVSCEMGLPFADVSCALATFSGVKRRFEIIGSMNGITVIDDYAHHPTEIAATIAAARSAGYVRVIVAFQPHLYSRTRDLLAEFAEALALADTIIVCEIYAAREEPIPGISGSEIIAQMTRLGHMSCRYVESANELPDLLGRTAHSGDCVILMGAGDIWKQGLPVLSRVGNE